VRKRCRATQTRHIIKNDSSNLGAGVIKISQPNDASSSLSDSGGNELRSLPFSISHFITTIPKTYQSGNKSEFKDLTK